VQKLLEREDRFAAEIHFQEGRPSSVLVLKDGGIGFEFERGGKTKKGAAKASPNRQDQSLISRTGTNRQCPKCEGAYSIPSPATLREVAGRQAALQIQVSKTIWKTD